MTHGQSREGVRVAVLTALLLLNTAISGCLNVPVEECKGTDCFPLNSDDLSDILASPDAFDVVALAATNEKLRIVATTTYEENGQFAEVLWDVAKDDNTQLRSISFRMTIGTTTIDNEVIEGQSTTNIRTGGSWYEGRDEVPEYSDPFIELAQLATQQPDGFWPPFVFDTTAVANLTWTISGDPTSTQQIASASNDTHTIIIELMGSPPKITGIETYSGDENTFILTVSKGDSVSIELQDGLPRTPIGFSIDGQPIQVGDTTVWYGEIEVGMSAEIDPSQLEFHGIVTENGESSSVAMMSVDQESSNITLDDGTWWEFNWLDFPMPGYFSAGDLYQIKTNSTGEIDAAVFDIWAQQWTGGPLLE
tara:strand:- start:3390 stop:4481 length:1092 start_codon:yes stop_codon:yes gene_type:complete